MVVSESPEQRVQNYSTPFYIIIDKRFLVVKSKFKMNTLSYKTISVNKETAKKEWVVIDCNDQVVGRLCSKVAKLLRGKYKPDRKSVV